MAAHSIGQLVRNAHTREEGHIVRIVSLSELFPKLEPHRQKESGYIVSLAPGHTAFVREVLWFQSEVVALDSAEGN
jgi:hypothetical protein